MWEGPAETLTLTENAQPALLATSVAVLRVLQDIGAFRGAIPKPWHATTGCAITAPASPRAPG